MAEEKGEKEGPHEGESSTKITRFVVDFGGEGFDGFDMDKGFTGYGSRGVFFEIRDDKVFESVEVSRSVSFSHFDFED